MLVKHKSSISLLNGGLILYKQKLIDQLFLTSGYFLNNFRTKAKSMKMDLNSNWNRMKYWFEVYVLANWWNKFKVIGCMGVICRLLVLKVIEELC